MTINGTFFFSFVISCKSESYELKGTDKKDRDIWVTFLMKISQEAMTNRELLIGDQSGKASFINFF